LTVTVSPVAVDRVKLPVDRLWTAPAVPPAAGPDRALDAPPEEAGPLGAAPLGAAPLGAAPDGLLPGLEDWLAQPPIVIEMTTAPAAMEPMSFRESIGELLLSMADRESAGHRPGLSMETSIDCWASVGATPNHDASSESVAVQAPTADACRASPLVVEPDCW
jgi:hypothetical protein